MRNGLKVVVGLVAAAPFLAGVALGQPAPPKPESRYTQLDHCREIANGGERQDWVAHRCEGLGKVPVWMTYMDSTRVGFAFGARQEASGLFSAERAEDWPLEWRGVDIGGAFRPYAVIVRVRIWGETSGSQLVVYRLDPSGASCLVGPAADSNEVARQIADASRRDPACSAT